MFAEKSVCRYKIALCVCAGLHMCEMYLEHFEGIGTGFVWVNLGIYVCCVSKGAGLCERALRQ